MSKEKAVRTAAEALHAAIGEAEAAGFAIAWPRRASELPGIGISQTAKAKVDIAKEAAKAGIATTRNPTPEKAAEPKPTDFKPKT